MNKDRKKPFRNAAAQIDLNLTGLLGSRGDALARALTRLEQAGTDKFWLTRWPLARYRWYQDADGGSGYGGPHHW